MYLLYLCLYMTPATHSTDKYKPGFTIVELLIVIVVIGILAAITIVAFNGVQNKAKASAAQSTVSQANKKILTYAAQNSDQYPPSLAVAGITNTDGLEYSYNNDSSPRTYGVTATNGVYSFFVSNTVTQPTTGGYAGHATGGVATITNLLTNTSVETDTVNLQNIGSVVDRTIARTAAANAVSGNYVLRITAGPSGGLAGYGSMSASLPVGRYTGSLWLRPSVAMAANVYFEGSSSRSNITDQGAALQPGQWSRVSRIFDVTAAGTVKVGFLMGNSVAQGQYVEVDGFMLTTGSTIYNFADGSSDNWVWNGPAHNATSTGVPQ